MKKELDSDVHYRRDIKMKININEIRQQVTRFVDSYPQQYNERNWWREPLVATAKVDDRFKMLRKMASKNHLMTQDLLATAKTVMVFFMPFNEELVKENHPGKFPCLNWGIAYEVTNHMIGKTCEHVQALLKENGYDSVLTAPTENQDADAEDDTMPALWPHKHLGYICNLGRFGINAQLITPSGCSGRMGSLVTGADIGNHGFVTKEELCLHKVGQKCLQCAARCPVKAVDVERGIDRHRCNKRLHYNWDNRIKLDLGERGQGCAKCQVNVPCSMEDPTKTYQFKL
jgi:epoxyqueuosine reductase QueG